MNKIRVRHVPRERDEEVLQLLDWRSEGITLAEMSRRVGLPYQRIQATLQAVDQGIEDYP